MRAVAVESLPSLLIYSLNYKVRSNRDIKMKFCTIAGTIKTGKK